MIQKILPATVAATEAFSDPPDVWLFPEEEDIIARAVQKRRNEFTTARACAREALSQLGIAPCPILHGSRGAPLWPDGVMGSITHCSGYRACAVARAGDVASVGIDAEPNESTPEGVVKTVTDDAERAHLAALSASRPDVYWDRLLFSAKESVYKTWFPLTGRWLGFEDARISIDPEAGTFTARLQVPGPTVNGTRHDSFTGRWIADQGLLVTAIVLDP
ncbi:MAG: 4'-phosphopantetheinyl transferase superfamily protein [Nocardiopsaceae bacterium]|nr:4'-phosphopantetheinyl transferase superfamily protein [Nocardiopsaceae bacterium]